MIGGPLATGRRRAIDHVLRTTAPMHDGFAGGAFVDTAGSLIGVTTAAAIRGLGVVIPASIAWQTAAAILEHGGLKRGYLGISGQTARLAAHQRDAIGRDEALVVVGVPAGSPAAAAGVLVGDVLFELDGHAIGSPEHLLDLLTGDRVGRQAALRLLRGGAVLDLGVTDRRAARGLMRVLLVGPASERARLRAQLDPSIEVAGEFASLADARAAEVDADAVLVVPVHESSAASALNGDVDDVYDVEPLTAREIQVLELLAEGLPNKAIAARLGISDQTVKFHVAALSGKLGAANRTDAVRRAVRRGLIAL